MMQLVYKIKLVQGQTSLSQILFTIVRLFLWQDAYVTDYVTGYGKIILIVTNSVYTISSYNSGFPSWYSTWHFH